MICTNPNMFRYRNAIFRQNTSTQDHKSNPPFSYPTCFGTGVPSSGRLRAHRITSPTLHSGTQHVSAPECHLQAVYEHKGSQVQPSIQVSNMFRHRSAIFRQTTNTQDHKSNAPLQVLIALSSLKYKNVKIPEYMKLAGIGIRCCGTNTI